MGRRRIAAVAVACLIGSTLVSQASAPAVELKEATMPGTADVVQSPANKGFWTVDVGGDVEAHDGARNYGTLRNHQLSHPIVGMSPTQSGKGYWLAGTDGGVFAFGDTRGSSARRVGRASTSPSSGSRRHRPETDTGSPHPTVVSSRSVMRGSSDRPVGCVSTSRSWASRARRLVSVTGS